MKSGEWRAPLIRMGRRLLSLVIAILIAVVIYSFFPLVGIRSGHLSNSEWLWFVLVLAIIARLYLSRKDATFASLNLPSLNTKGVSYPEELLAKEYLDSFKRVISADEFEDMIETIADPGTVVLRISETAVLGGRDYSTTVKRTVVPANPNLAQIFVPVLRPRKGELIDNFSVQVDSRPARTLSHGETVGATIAVMTNFASMAFEDSDEFPRVLWGMLRSEILNETATDESQRKLILSEIRRLCQKPAISEGADIARVALLNLVVDIFDTYLIVVVAPISGSSLKIETSYSRRREIYEIPEGKPRVFKIWYWLHIQLQVFLGLILRSDEYKLVQAVEAQSYHFRASVPEGMYVYDLACTWIDRTGDAAIGTVGSDAITRPFRPEWTVSDTRGLTHIHAYGRDLDAWLKPRNGDGQNAISRTAAIKFELRERPPGLMFVVMLISVYLASIALAVGRWYPLVFKAGESSSWPAILFGVPAIVSGWVVSRFTAESVRLLSISTISVTVWACLNAASAAALSALSISVPAPMRDAPLGIGQWQLAWSILVVSAVSCAVLSILLLGLRTRRYARRIRQKVPPINQA